MLRTQREANSFHGGGEVPPTYQPADYKDLLEVEAWILGFSSL